MVKTTSWQNNTYIHVTMNMTKEIFSTHNINANTRLNLREKFPRVTVWRSSWYVFYRFESTPKKETKWRVQQTQRNQKLTSSQGFWDGNVYIYLLQVLPTLFVTLWKFFIWCADSSFNQAQTICFVNGSIDLLTPCQITCHDYVEILELIDHFQCFYRKMVHTVGSNDSRWCVICIISHLSGLKRN